MALAAGVVQGGRRSCSRLTIDSATKHFTEVLDTFPGELAPKLALGGHRGTGRQRPTSGPFYETVWHTDNNIISAGFGLARAQSVEGDRESAVTTLDEVPDRLKAFHHRTIDQCGDAAVRPLGP